jgi:hypothetical protein
MGVSVPASGRSSRFTAPRHKPLSGRDSHGSNRCAAIACRTSASFVSDEETNPARLAPSVSAPFWSGVNR